MNRPNLDDFKYRYKSKAFYVTKYSEDLDKYINYLEAELKAVKNNSPLPNINNSVCTFKGCNKKTVDMDNLWCSKHDKDING